MRHGLHARKRRGFTLGEVLVTTAIIVILAALTIQNVQSRLVTGRGSALARELASLNAGLQAFRTNVGTYPLYLDYLSAMPASLAETYCSTLSTQVYFTTGTGSQTANWRGPYITRVIASGTNYTTADNNTIVDKLTHTSGSTILGITVNTVDSTVAAVVEELVDGPVQTGSYSAGNFTYTPSSKVASYRLSVPSC